MSDSAGAGRRVLFRVDAGESIGLGHAARSTTLAAALVLLGWRPVFFTRWVEPWRDLQLAAGCELRGLGTIVPGSEADASTTARLAVELDADWVVIDGYVFGPSFARLLGREQVLWIDDLGFDDERRGSVLNANLYASPRLYPHIASDRLLLGPRFALLRDEFTTPSDEPRAPAEVPRVLVTLGGADPPDVGSKVLAAIDELRKTRRIDTRVLVGSANPRASSLAKREDVIVGARNVAQHMRWSDIAITAAGGTCLELASLGVPAIAIAIADNQRGVAEALNQRGMMQSLGWHADVTPAIIAGAVTALLADEPRQKEMVMRQRAEVDGQGARRVAERLFARTS